MFRYFCHDGCCFGCCSGGGEFIDEADGGGGRGCQELSVIDRLREKADREEEEDDDGEEGLASRVTTALLTPISMVRKKWENKRRFSIVPAAKAATMSQLPAVLFTNPLLEVHIIINPSFGEARALKFPYSFILLQGGATYRC